MKKFICLFMSLIVTFCTSIQAFAFSIEAANNSIYKEINQIDLSDIKFSIDEDNTIKAFSVSEEGETSINKLEEKLSSSDNLKSALINMIESGNQPVAVSYTTVYLKQVYDNNDYHLEPMTKGDISIRATGPNGSLSLYTLASRTNSNKLVAQSVAQWNDVSIDFTTSPAAAADYISITVPSTLTFYSDDFSATTTSGASLSSSYWWHTNQEYTSTVYAFYDYIAQRHTVSSVNLSMTCTGNNSSSIVCISKYVHTWGTIPAVGIAIGPTSVTFSTGAASWQLANSLTLPAA